MRAFLLSLVCVPLLCGCFGGAGGQIDSAEYDLSATAVSANAGTLPALRLKGVQAPAWLATSAMQYRLAYADPARRFSYAGSRWVAPPAELVEQTLRRGNLVGDLRNGCQLSLDIDEFVQMFDTPESSRAVLEAHATLFAPGSDGAIVARRAFALAPAAGADARSGVVAFAAATRGLHEELTAWLARPDAGSSPLIETCRNAGVAGFVRPAPAAMPASGAGVRRE